MDNELINEIDFNDIKLSPEDRIKLPGRRVLSSRPWSEEQLQCLSNGRNTYLRSLPKWV